MRFRLLRRRLTLSSPRMAIRSSLPWPFRWLAVAVVLGLCCAVALWTFEKGKNLAGVDHMTREEQQQLRSTLQKAQADLRQQQDMAFSAGTLLTTERAASERLGAQVKQLEAENRSLRDDLGFFEKLIPASKGDGVSIRALHAERLDGDELRWQVLLIQPQRNAPEFKGRLELTASGTLQGAPWTSSAPLVGQVLSFQQYRRAEGVVAVPAAVVVQTITARVLEGTVVRSVQTFAMNG